jgi:tRNA-modifying protein YgfZ
MADPIPVHSGAWAAVIHVTGDDAFDFLHSQCSNDLRSLNAGPVYGLWLDHKGRIQAASWVLRSAAEHGFLLVSSDSPADLLLAWLGKHIIADDVALADLTTDYCRFATPASFDPQLGLPTADSSAVTWMVAGHRREWLVRADQTAALRAGALPHTTPWSAEAMEWQHIAHREIRIGVDTDPQATTPADVGLLEYAVSLTKGCFPGQEVVARQARLGRAAAQPIVLAASCALPPATPADLWSADSDTPVGRLSRIAQRDNHCLALALIKRSCAAAVLRAGARDASGHVWLHTGQAPPTT